MTVMNKESFARTYQQRIDQADATVAYAMQSPAVWQALHQDVGKLMEPMADMFAAQRWETAGIIAGKMIEGMSSKLGALNLNERCSQTFLNDVRRDMDGLRQVSAALAKGFDDVVQMNGDQPHIMQIVGALRDAYDPRANGAADRVAELAQTVDGFAAAQEARLKAPEPAFARAVTPG